MLNAARLLSAARAACLQHWQRRDGRSRRRADGGRGGAAAAARGAASSATSSDAHQPPCHYEVLGLARGASREQIKRAIRQLARQWHPDVNPSPAANERFQAISIAFEVLSDEGEREQYDAMHRGSSSSGATRSSSSSSAGGGSAGRAPSERPPPDIHARLQLDFREAALGARRSVDVIVEDACCNCGGSGAAPGSMPPPCEMCKGRGEITKRQRLGALNAFNHETGYCDFHVCCPICGGRGYQVAHPCGCCGGAGLAAQPRRVAVRVPPGAEDGGRLRLAGEGDVARVGGPRGGLVLELHVLQEASIWRSGLDLHSQLAVPLWDAALGGTATVHTLRGTASLAIPPGTQHGAVLSLAAAGVEREGAGRGQHHFEVLVELPRQVSSAEVALLQRLAELQRWRGGARSRRQGEAG